MCKVRSGISSRQLYSIHGFFLGLFRAEDRALTAVVLFWFHLEIGNVAPTMPVNSLFQCLPFCCLLPRIQDGNEDTGHKRRQQGLPSCCEPLHKCAWT